jgi:CRP/FNR family transcriptional regulator, anaerobic regulatory protein
MAATVPTLWRPTLTQRKSAVGQRNKNRPFLTTRVFTMHATTTPPRLDALKVACSACNLRELCLPVGLSDAELVSLDQMIGARRAVRRGERLFHAGEAFTALYAVRTGFFKTTVAAEDGREQVTGFQMAGELLGLDGISTDHHACDATALEDSQVCMIPYGQLESLSREFTLLQHQFHKIMSREIVRDHGVMLLLGSMRAEERLAAFLLNLTLFPLGAGAAHDPRGDRQLPGSEAGDRQPHLLQVPGRGHPRSQAARHPHPRPGCAAAGRERRQLLTQTRPAHFTPPVAEWLRACSAGTSAAFRVAVVPEVSSTGSGKRIASASVMKLATTTTSGPPTTSHTIL